MRKQGFEAALARFIEEIENDPDHDALLEALQRLK